MFFEYDAWDERHKSPFGAVKSNTEIMFRVHSDADQVYLVGFNKKKQMKRNGEWFEISVVSQKEIGTEYYRFDARFGDHAAFYGRSEGDAQAVVDGGEYQLTIYQGVPVPAWFKGGVMYQVYVDRFFKGSTRDVVNREGALIHTNWNEAPLYVKDDRGHIVSWDFFGGNLDGVIKKLKYFKSLGIDIIYLNPVFEARSNHKYDTADYSRIDRMYGTDKTLRRLVRKANKLKMKIMLDGVFSHTGSDSIYFNLYKTYGKSGAYHDKRSPYYEWYNFKNHPDDYDCWWGVTDLPCVNELNPSFMDYMLNEKTGVITQWMKTGIAGWRLDVADELPDAFIKALKYTIRQVNPEAVLLGEVWEDASNKVSYGKNREYILDHALDSVSNYPMRDALIELLMQKISSEQFSNRMMTLQENYPRDVFLSLMNMTGTHDTERLFTLMGDAPSMDSMSAWEARDYWLSDAQASMAMSRVMAYLIIMFMFPGNPCIYYGDEIGLQGFKDPYNRGTFDWAYKEDRLIILIKKLNMLRKSREIHKGFIRFKKDTNCLLFDVECEECKTTIWVNASNQMVKTVCGKNKKAIFTHKTKWSDGVAEIEPYGAIIF